MFRGMANVQLPGQEPTKPILFPRSTSCNKRKQKVISPKSLIDASGKERVGANQRYGLVEASESPYPRVYAPTRSALNVIIGLFLRRGSNARHLDAEFDSWELKLIETIQTYFEWPWALTRLELVHVKEYAISRAKMGVMEKITIGALGRRRRGTPRSTGPWWWVHRLRRAQPWGVATRLLGAVKTERQFSLGTCLCQAPWEKLLNLIYT